MKLTILIAHAVFALSLLALGYTAKNYLGLTRVTLPVLEAIAPVTADKTAQVIALRLADATHGEKALKFVRGQAKQLRVVHQNWLAHAQLQKIYMRNQLIAWAVISLLSLLLVILLHNRHKAAA